MTTITRPTAGELEQRSAPDVELDARRLRGVVPFGQESRDLGGWREVMEPGCLDRTELRDLVATVDHAGVPLARHPGTLQLDRRDDGLHWSLELPSSRDEVREAVERGDLCQSSWRMVVGEDRWQGAVRHIVRVDELRDVAVVTTAAYEAATAEYRNREGGAVPETATIETEVEDRTNPTEPEPSADPPPAARGTLRVEDRSHRHERPIESRIVDAIRSVAKGEARALTTVDASAGPIVPEDLNAYVWQHIEAANVFLRSGVTVISTDRHSIQMPVLNDGVSPVWTAELEQIGKADPDLDELTATPKKLALITEASNEALDDSSPDLLTFIQQALLRGMARKIDAECIAGSDTDGITGVVNWDGIGTQAAPATLANYDPLVIAAAKVTAQGFPGTPVAIVHPFTELALALMKNEAGDPVIRPTEGLPTILVSDQVPVTGGTADALVFAPSAVAVVRRRDATLDIDRTGPYFQNDSAGVRVRARLDLVVGRPSGVVKITGLPAAAPA